MNMYGALSRFFIDSCYVWSPMLLKKIKAVNLCCGFRRMSGFPKLASDKKVFQDILKNCDNFLFDCDGVLWQGNVPIDVGSYRVIPGTGCMVNSVSTAAGRKPDVLCGKPETYMYKIIEKCFKLDPSRTMMIGDRLNTDMLFGNRNKLETALVFTGFETKESLERAAASDDPEMKEQVPNYYTPSIGDWRNLFP